MVQSSAFSRKAKCHEETKLTLYDNAGDFPAVEKVDDGKFSVFRVDERKSNCAELAKKKIFLKGSEKGNHLQLQTRKTSSVGAKFGAAATTTTAAAEEAAAGATEATALVPFCLTSSGQCGADPRLKTN